MLSPILSSSGSFGVIPFLFLSLAFLASFRLCATMLYSFVSNPTLIMLSFVLRYFGFSDSSSVCFTAALHPNIRINGAIPEDSVGKSCMLLWLSTLGHPIPCEFLVVLLSWL